MEALENASGVSRNSRFEELKASQLKRQGDLRALKDEYAAALTGVESQLKEKKEKQAEFLRKKLELRKLARARELMSDGLEYEDAQMLADEEKAADENRELVAIEKIYQDGILKQQAALDEGMRQALSELKTKHSDTLSAMEIGLVDVREQKRKALELKLQQRRLEKLKEAKQAGLSDVEAELQVDALMREEQVRETGHIESGLKDIQVSF